jgi:DNA-directed RNA polymerase subunit RPC12/RpoP
VPALFVECHRCGREFPSGVTLSEDGIRGYLNDGAIRRCPHCGTVDPYFTAEHRLGRSTGSSARNRTPFPPVSDFLLAISPTFEVR